MSYIYPVKSCETIRYRVYYLHQSKKIYIGLYNDLEKATHAYDLASRLLNNPIPLEACDDQIIDFKKCVSLINFRENGIYFNNPIYVYPTYFDYYFSVDCKYTFDLKDLFFLTHNKLCQRGNYLYVTLHSRQENLLRRFGILNHASEGKDYIFKNGNPSDFRRENLHLLNHYIGVSFGKKHGKPTYTSKILFNNYITIGHYDSELEAAIAYNKAVDLLASKCTDSKFIKNDIPYLTRSEYQSLYERIVLSKRFTHPTHQNRVTSNKLYRGISKDKSGYRASIGYKGKQIYLGIYPTPFRAAQAYNFASLYLYGHRGYTNDIYPLTYSSDELKIASKLEKAGVLKKD